MVRKGQPEAAAGTARGARFAITAFLLWNLFAIVSWCVPLESPLIARCRSIARPYLVYTGLFQKWDMFAPDPSKVNQFVAARIVYRDGASAVWKFPQMEDLGYRDRYVMERYRKYANDCLFLDANAGIWLDAARWVSRKNARPGNPPVSVALVRYWSVVPPPGPNGETAESPWNQYVFFRYNVEAGDLE